MGFSQSRSLHPSLKHPPPWEASKLGGKRSRDCCDQVHLNIFFVTEIQGLSDFHFGLSKGNLEEAGVDIHNILHIELKDQTG